MSKPKKKIVFFDADGVIFDSAPGIIQSMKYAIKKYGITLPDGFDAKNLIGPPFAISLERFGANDKETADIIREYGKAYFKGTESFGAGMYNAEVYAGMAELLEKLYKTGEYIIATASSKFEEAVFAMVAEFGLSPYFDYVFGADNSVGRFHKVDVLKYGLTTIGLHLGDKTLQEVSKSGITDASAVLVGDRLYDTNGAHSIGIPCIGATWGYGEKDELEKVGTDVIVDKPEEVFDAIKALIG